jgi:hypothetical protein
VCVLAASCKSGSKAQDDARCPDYQPLKNVYFGDLHVHTSYSFDAYDYGVRSDPASAYAFARGSSVDVVPVADPAAGQTSGPPGVKLNFSAGKLDFMAVTDHAEFLGSQHGCLLDPKSGFYDKPYCAALRGAPNPNFEDNKAPNWVVGSPCLGTMPGNGVDRSACTEQTRIAWDALQQATSAAYERCSFTTLHAFEWTGVRLDTNPRATLHRNVFFGTDSVPAMPLDFISVRDEKALFKALDDACDPAAGCDALAIPHNTNQSQGKMFDVSTWAPDDVARAVRYQRLVEIHQHKGNSECLTDTADNGAVTPCDFELETGDTDPTSAPGYVRPGLENGLVYHAANGVNPLQLGFVGATDTHNATPGRVDESGWVGNLGVEDNTPLLRLRGIAGQNPGGVTGVWAEENTREAIWAALKRREVFATSGPRIVVRFYAYTQQTDPCKDAQFPAGVLAAGGAPMGGTLPAGAPSASFVVYALQDKTPLAEVDIVKASVEGGTAREKIHTIRFAAAPYCVTWTDPEFRPSASAFYYARVKEQPTPRWSHYDCVELRKTNPNDWQTLVPGCVPGAAGGLDAMIQERAWTSPIWQLPGK